MVDASQTGPLLVEQHQIKTIVIQGKNFPEPDKYRGQIQLPSRILYVNGRRISSTQLIFTIDNIEDALPLGIYEANMKVLWTEHEFNIEANHLTLTLYSCPDQALGDCTFCKNLALSNPAMNCKWCSDQCIYSLHNCSDSLCPVPIINSINPRDGSIDGGTQISIKGKHIGVSRKQIDNITVAGVPCTNVSIIDRVVQCVTGPSSVSVGPIILLIDGQIGVSSAKFTYKDPQLLGLSPSEILQSGGRSITLTGRNLQIGNRNIRVELIDESSNTKTCSVKMKISSSKEIICVPEPSNSTGPHIIEVFFDNTSVRTLQNMSLTYLSDPVVQETEPSEFKSIYSGGLSFAVIGSGFVEVIDELTVHFSGHKENGENLDAVATKDDYYIRVGSEECIITDLQNSSLTCTPPYTEPTPLSTEEKLFIRVEVGFLTVVVGDLIYPSSTWYIVITVSITVVFVGVVTIAVLRLRKLKSRKKQEAQNYVQNVQVLGYEMLRINRDQTDKHGIDESIVDLLKSKGLLISPDDIRIGDCVGKGNFGIVYEGTLTKAVENNEIKVAIKSLHDKGSQDIDVKEFVNEALQMADFHHPNVMTLIGICLASEMPLVILPFMGHGDMLTYIRDKNNVMTLLNILHFAADIARGMEYLTLQRVVHRDLAARNCMLGDDKTVVVADFGLSRDIYEKNYYCVSNKNCKLPVKWMAPESLEKGLFTTQSDVWSFGVVLWELVTRGNKPYPEVDGWDMLRFLKMNRKLQQPQYCPDVLYSVMSRCWDLDPDRRPIFPELVGEMTRFTTPSSDDNYLEPTATYEQLRNTYVNVELGVDYLDLH
ncbi:macrophage-stimulating protein receptor-like [Saccostrea cucullata]|uniref:macrophage-stimulating protein receptor-like n=1 Tax=Saccostrea cuccullata TaxID=36930 RepID=UPI002ED04F42